MKRKKLDRNNILCVCGHPWGEHGWAKFPYAPLKWNECYGTNEDYECIDDRCIDCSCDDYQQDNLEYLKEMYERKKRSL